MAASTITPPAAAPAAAPSAPAPAAPAAPAAAAPAAPVTPVPAAPAPATETRSMTERLAEGWDKAKASVPLEETPEGDEAAAAPVVADPAAAPAVEDPAAAAPAAEPAAPAAEPAAPAAEPAAPEFQIDFDDVEAGDPAAFFNEVKKDAGTEKFFNDHPALKNAVAGALRRDKENREIREYVPDLESAKAISSAAATFQVIDNHFLDATNPEGAQQFLNHWIQEAMIVDDKGQPVMENGKYKLHPALPYIFDHIAGNKLDIYADQVKTTGQLPAQMLPIVDALRSFAVSKGDERLQAVADVLKEALSSPSSSALGEVPDDLKPYADSLTARENALSDKEKADAARQQQESRAAHSQSIENAESKAADSVIAQLKPRLEASGLDEKQQGNALREIGEQIEARLGKREENGKWSKGTHSSSKLFQSTYESILKNNPPGEARERKLARHLLTNTQQVLGRITTNVIRDYTKAPLARQTAKLDTVASQTRNSATDPRGASIAPSSPQSQTPAQLRAEVVKDLTTKLGRDPEMNEVMAEQFKRVNAPRK